MGIHLVERVCNSSVARSVPCSCMSTAKPTYAESEAHGQNDRRICMHEQPLCLRSPHHLSPHFATHSMHSDFLLGLVSNRWPSKQCRMRCPAAAKGYLSNECLIAQTFLAREAHHSAHEHSDKLNSHAGDGTQDRAPVQQRAVAPPAFSYVHSNVTNGNRAGQASHSSGSTGVMCGWTSTC